MKLMYNGETYDMESFKNWLKDRGAQVVQPTNEYEAARWFSNGVTNVIYRNAQNRITSFVNEAKYIFECYYMNRAWKCTITTSTPLKGRNFKQQIQDMLIIRDGTSCFYCTRELTDDEITLEHLVPSSHGGPNHLSNLAIACAPCNNSVGNLSVVEKIQMRDAMRKKLTLSHKFAGVGYDKTKAYDESFHAATSPIRLVKETNSD